MIAPSLRTLCQRSIFYVVIVGRVQRGNRAGNHIMLSTLSPGRIHGPELLGNLPPGEPAGTEDVSSSIFTTSAVEGRVNKEV